MSNRRCIVRFALYGAVVSLSVVAVCSTAWAQIDITDAALPHVADSVIWDWYMYYAPENVSNNILGGDTRLMALRRRSHPASVPAFGQIDFGTPRGGNATQPTRLQ